jgi:betaine-aldehyde dehydrogenase
MANDTVYGLAAAVFGDDAAKCSMLCNKLRAGIVWLNNCQPAFIQCPWGGVKQSGFGRELGRWGLEEFTSVKQVTAVKPGYAWGIF